MTQRVLLYKYDLTNGMAAQLSHQMLGTHFEAIWHTAVVCFDREFYFDGGVGIVAMHPGTTRFGRPLQVEDMGLTSVSPSAFAEWIHSKRIDFGPNSYNLLQRNCNHFSSEALLFLVGRPVPDDVAHMIDRVLATPLGAMMRPSLEMMSVAPPGQSVDGSSDSFFVPPAGNPSLFGNTASLQADAQAQLFNVIARIADEDDIDRAINVLSLLQRIVTGCLDNPDDPRVGRLNVASNTFACARGHEGAFEVLSLLGFEPSATEDDRYVLNTSVALRDAFEKARQQLQSCSASARELQQALLASA